MRDDTIQALEGLFREFPAMCAGSVSSDEVDALERKTGFPLPADYREFVERYGGAVVGAYSVYGAKASELMGADESSAIQVTNRYRNDGWPGTQEWLVVSSDHADNPVGLDSGGVIWISDHDFGGAQLLAKSFEEYLRKWCLRIEPMGGE